MDAIKPIPDLPKGLREAALRGTLIPFVGAGASRIAGCPDWTEFADGALSFFIAQGKFSHSQLDQIKHLNPRVKLSIALGLQREHGAQIDFKHVLYPTGRNDNASGRRLYGALCKLGTTFVTTNYDDWLDNTIETSMPSAQNTSEPAKPTIKERPTIVTKVNALTPDCLSRPNTVIHLHGSMHEPEGMILTTQHYVRHYANDRLGSHGEQIENNVLTFLDYLFTEKSVLFVGYGLAELEILEYVIVKARLNNESGRTEMRHFLLQGFFSHEQEVARSLIPYYRECGIELLPFLRDRSNWDQLIDVLEEFGRLSPAGPPLKIQRLLEMKDLLG
jgi:hypothetical protein